MNELMWWGYLHVSGTVQVKRWFGDVKDYTEDCDGNEFVVRVVRPFACPTQQEAARIIRDRLGV